jgi:hypothetical protein
MVAPALPSLAADLKVTDEVVSQLMLSIFVLAYAVGPLFLGPLSEIYGRTIDSAARQPLLLSFQHRVRGVTNESPNDSLPLLRWTRRQCPASSKPSRKPNPKKSLYLTASRSAAGSFQIASGLKSAERASQSTVLHHS